MLLGVSTPRVSDVSFIDVSKAHKFGSLCEHLYVQYTIMKLAT